MTDKLNLFLDPEDLIDIIDAMKDALWDAYLNGSDRSICTLEVKSDRFHDKWDVLQLEGLAPSLPRIFIKWSGLCSTFPVEFRHLKYEDPIFTDCMEVHRIDVSNGTLWKGERGEFRRDLVLTLIEYLDKALEKLDNHMKLNCEENLNE